MSLRIPSVVGLVTVGWLAVAALPARAIEYYNLTHRTAAGAVDDSLATANIANGGNGSGGAVGIFTTSTNNVIVGTGVISPFVRIQPPHNVNCAGGHPCTEAGYNTTGGVTPNPGNGNVNTPQFETKENEGHNWNHTLRLENIGKSADGLYREFILDINEAVGGPKNDEYLSLDKFKLFISTNGNLDNFNAPDHGGVGANTADNYYFMDQNNVKLADSVVKKIYDIDGGDVSVDGQNTNNNQRDSSIGLNYLLNSGSGNGQDLVVRIPDALFDVNMPFVYLYSSFGEVGYNDSQNRPAANLPTGDFGQSAGFEEWATRRSITVNPVPGTALLLACGAFMLYRTRRQRSA